MISDRGGKIMPWILEITNVEIKMLRDVQLTDVLKSLLYLEVNNFGIPSLSVDVPLSITISDGGEDGRVKWSGGPESTDWIPKRFTLFQCKATDMNEAICHHEVLNRTRTQLKPRVEEVFDSGGCYVLFYGRDCNTERQVPRIAAIRQAIGDVGKAYADTAEIRIYDANKIAEWVNKYPAVIYKVCAWVGKIIPFHCQNWSMWKNYGENKYIYVTDSNLQAHLATLRSHFQQPKAVARIIGLSGLGKTRLALETFRAPENAEDDFVQQALSNEVVYIDAANYDKSLVSEIGQLRILGKQGILVVDNCDQELHYRLQREISHQDSRLSLLTLDYNPEQSSTGNYSLIRLEPVSDSIIKNILQQAYPSLKDPDIGRIVEFAQGFPQMAVLLANAHLQHAENLGSLQEDILVERLLGINRRENPIAYNVISGCALFDKLGFLEDVSDQRQFVADSICRISQEDFHRHGVGFIKRGILDQRHRYVRVVPKPLALRLAADWWQTYPPESIIPLLDSLPDPLAEALCNQMSMLDFLPDARSAVENLCGPQGPFGQAEVLNSNEGSRLFRSLVEVNPQATAKCLKQVFDGWSREQLLEVGPGRRNLIWALEKLCFWQDTFSIAAPILLAFATAENESWGNNATNQFLQLFHVFLSGTQAPPELRLTVIDTALSDGNNEQKNLAVKALGSALQNGHFSRTGGVETQGSRSPQIDWRPKLWSEVYIYWQECLKRLVSVATGSGESALLARGQFAKSLRGLVRAGRLDEVEHALKVINDSTDSSWPEAYNAIKEEIRHEGKIIPQDSLVRLKTLLDVVSPQTLGERLSQIVSTPTWDHVKDEKSGHYIDVAKQEAVRFAEECSKNMALLLENLEVVFKGEQRQGYAFGFNLGQFSDEAQPFIENALKILSDMGDANPMVLAGFLQGIRSRFPEMVAKTLDMVAQDERLAPYLVNLTRFGNPDEIDLQRIVNLVKERKIEASQLHAFKYGSALDHLNPNIIISFCQKIVEYDPFAAGVALEIVYMYCLNDTKRFRECSAHLRNTVRSTNFLLPNIKTDHYTWEETIKQLLLLGRDEELAQGITEQCIQACSQPELIFELSHSLEPVLRILLREYRNTVWPILSEALLSDDYWLMTNLEDIFNPSVKVDESAQSLLLELPIEFIKEWCDRNRDKAPLKLPRLIPLLESKDGTTTWNDLIMYLIEQYAEQDVLLEIFRNLGPRGWSGSIIPYFKLHIEALSQLLSHRNTAVKTWATKLIGALQEDIKRENLREQEQEWGIY